MLWNSPILGRGGFSSTMLAANTAAIWLLANSWSLELGLMALLRQRRCVMTGCGLHFTHDIVPLQLLLWCRKMLQHEFPVLYISGKPVVTYGRPGESTLLRSCKAKSGEYQYSSLGVGKVKVPGVKQWPAHFPNKEEPVLEAIINVLWEHPCRSDGDSIRQVLQGEPLWVAS